MDEERSYTERRGRFVQNDRQEHNLRVEHHFVEKQPKGEYVVGTHARQR